MRATIKIMKELATNLLIIHRLALNDLLIQNKGNIFGVLWLWLNPAIQIGIYGFVFGSGIRNSVPVDGVPFFIWLIPGFIAWSFISTTLTKGSRSIINNMGILTKMRFPVSISPAVVVASELYVHILMVITIAIIITISGIRPTMQWLLIFYYMFSATMFLYSFALFNSAITTVIRDYQHVVYNVMRAAFFFTPVLFVMKDIKSRAMLLIMKFNPFTYIVEGYREVFLNKNLYIFSSVKWGLYFWTITCLLFIVGAILNLKMRKNLLDYA